MSTVPAVLALEQFRLAFRRRGGPDHVLFDGVTIAVPSGGFYLLVGESGSGKSTILKLIAGLWDPREPAPRIHGRLRVLGVPVGTDYPRALRGRVQAVLQEEGLLDELSPRENVELGLRVAGRSPKLALALLSQAGLDNPPQEVSALSGGMRKRLAVARALAGDPELLVFDEPTAGLDRESARDIAGLLVRTHRSAGERRTTIVITHDLRAFEGLHDAVLSLEPGRKTLELVAPGAVARERHAVARLPESAAPATHGLQRVLLACASFLDVLVQAIVRLPPVFPGIVLRTTTRFVLEAVFFVVVGSATVGGLATYFALRNNPLEGAFTGAVITGAGKVLVAVLIPLLAGFFFTARIAAGAAARLGTMKRTSQIDALELMGIRPADYLLTPLVWGVSLAMPIVTASGVTAACVVSFLASRAVTDISTLGWGRSFAAEIDVIDLRFALLKTVVSGFLVAIMTYYLAVGPKRSGRDVGVAVNSSIVVGIFLVLLVHAVVTLVQFP